MMKMRKQSFLAGMFVGILAILSFAGVTHFTALSITEYISAGTYLQATTEVRSPEYNLGYSAAGMDSLGRIIMTVRNKAGATIPAGRVMEWDTTEVLVDSLQPNTASTFTLATEGSPTNVKVVGKGTPTNDSVYIYGNAITGIQTIAATTEIFNLVTTADDIRWSSYLWDSIDSIKFDSGAAAGIDTLRVYLVSSRGVKQATGSSFLIAGVTLESIADNAVGEICVYGNVKVDSKTGSVTFIRNGWPVTVAGTGSVIPLPIAQFVTDSIGLNYAGKVVGWGLGSHDDVADTNEIWIHFNSQ